MVASSKTGSNTDPAGSNRRNCVSGNHSRMDMRFSMTAEQWADMVFQDAMLPPGADQASIAKSSINRSELTNLIEKIQRESRDAAIASSQPMPGAELSMRQIDEMSEFVDKIASKFKNRTSIDVREWEQLPKMFRSMRDYALFLQGPLSDIVNDSSAHYDNWARIRQESYNEALADALKEIEDAESELEKRDILTSRKKELLLENIPDILMRLMRKITESTPLEPTLMQPNEEGDGANYEAPDYNYD